MPFIFRLPDLSQTEALARAVMAGLGAGDCVLLSGPVGAGKSAFARAAIQSQMDHDGTLEDVPSPTFTLVQTYETSKGEIWHADLYRIGTTHEVAELGLDDAIAGAITLIEWPDRLGPFKPERHLSVDIGFAGDDETRVVTLSPAGSGWEWVAGLAGAELAHG